MGSSEKTPGLGLSIFSDSDKPTWRGDYAADMQKIDADSVTKTAAIGAATNTANNALTAANNADAKAVSAGNTAATALQGVNDLSPRLTSVESDVLQRALKDEVYTKSDMLKTGWLRGSNGKTYRVVACALRNTGTGWSVIDDAGHSPSLVRAVNATTTRISLEFNTDVLKIASLVVTPDETFAKEGLFVGASVGIRTAEIEIHKNTGGILSDYVYYDTGSSSWVSAKGVYQITNFNAGVLTLTHAECDDTNGVSVTTRGTNKRLVTAGSVGPTTTLLGYQSIVDGSVVTTPDTGMGVFVTRYGAKTTTKQINPQAFSSAGGNFWVIGIFETAE